MSINKVKHTLGLKRHDELTLGVCNLKWKTKLVNLVYDSYTGEIHEPEIPPAMIIKLCAPSGEEFPLEIKEDGKYHISKRKRSRFLIEAEALLHIGILKEEQLYVAPLYSFGCRDLEYLKAHFLSRKDSLTWVEEDASIELLGEYKAIVTEGYLGTKEGKRLPKVNNEDVLLAHSIYKGWHAFSSTPEGYLINSASLNWKREYALTIYAIRGCPAPRLSGQNANLGPKYAPLSENLFRDLYHEEFSALFRKSVVNSLGMTLECRPIELEGKLGISSQCMNLTGKPIDSLPPLIQIRKIKVWNDLMESSAVDVTSSGKIRMLSSLSNPTSITFEKMEITDEYPKIQNPSLELYLSSISDVEAYQWLLSAYATEGSEVPVTLSVKDNFCEVSLPYPVTKVVTAGRTLYFVRSRKGARCINPSTTKITDTIKGIALEVKLK